MFSMLNTIFYVSRSIEVNLRGNG